MNYNMNTHKKVTSNNANATSVCTALFFFSLLSFFFNFIHILYGAVVDDGSRVTR